MRIITVADNNYSRILGLVENLQEESQILADNVKNIVRDIRQHGDAALVAYTNKFDANSLTVEQLKVSEEEIELAYKNLTPDLLRALELAYSRTISYYDKLKPHDLLYTDELGVTLGARWVPIDSVGIYVPGGKAIYPSSVIMNAAPAIVAGVQKLVMACPAGSGNINPVVLAAARICGIKDIYKIGGAQAVAALSYGTETIPRVNKMVGGGNKYVTEAKRQVFGHVGIDMIAGPSEILVIADEFNNPDWVAADLLSQAEHEESARAILITNNHNFAQRVIASVYELILHLDRRVIAEKSIEDNGLVVVVSSFSEAVDLANQIGPEHLQLAVTDPNELLPHVTNAGSVFLGRYTPEAIGDYIAGPSHVLPTSGNAKFASGLSVHDFMKRQSVVGCDEASFKHLAEPTMLLAAAEKLTAHALSISIRSQKDGK